MSLGQYPQQTGIGRQMIVALMFTTLTSLLVPAMLQFLSSMREQDIDTMMECAPVIATLLGTMIKMINHNNNKVKFENIFNLMAELWETAEINGDVHVLNEITEQGSKMGSLYRKSIWGFVTLFLCVPMFCPILDYVAPLNETRPKQPLFKLNYMMNTDDYFYTVYFHSAWCSLITVLIVTTIDSLYIVIIHYTCGLFAVCGHQIKKAAEIERRNTNTTSRNNDLLKRCVLTHYEAIRFHEYMDESTRMSYLFEICLNMIGMTVTAVQTVMYFDKPEEAFRIVMFLLGQQFHLYIISVPGQMLIDQSFQLVNDIYFSNWYEIPVQFEKMLHIMLIRSSRPCKLTAGGLYEMNIENFGSIVKNCMSYFTVLLSFRE